MHLVENLALLAADLEAHVHAELRQFGTDLLKALRALRPVNDHHHVEVILNDSLRDVEDVDVGLGEIGGRLGNDADGVLADNGDDNFFHGAAIIAKIAVIEAHRNSSINWSNYGHVRFAAERTDGTVVNRRAAVRTATLENLATDGAELAADRILLDTIRAQQTPAVHEVFRMRRAEGIRTVRRMRLDLADDRQPDDRRFSHGLCRRQINVELVADLLDRLVVQLGAITLLDHGDRILLAADFGGKPALRQTRSNTGLPHLFANLWTQIYHGAYYGLSSVAGQEGYYQQLSTSLSTYLPTVYISVDMFIVHSVHM